MEKLKPLHADIIKYDERQRIGNIIKAIRSEKGISQRQLAELAGITPANVANIELGKYSVGLDVLSRIAKSLKCKIELTRI